MGIAISVILFVFTVLCFIELYLSVNEVNRLSKSCSMYNAFLAAEKEKVRILILVIIFVLMVDIGVYIEFWA